MIDRKIFPSGTKIIFDSIQFDAGFIRKEGIISGTWVEKFHDGTEILWYVIDSNGREYKIPVGSPLIQKIVG